MSDDRPRVSTRDRHELRDRLAGWLSARLDAPEVSALDAPATTGMSSETVMFEVASATGRQRCVLRLPPDAAAYPVFPAYDMERQYRAMALVARRSSVPVPRTLWFEPDPSHLGAPFFVMERVEGRVPPDVMPYTFGGNWLADATADQRARAEEGTVAVLAALHGIDLGDGAGDFLEFEAAGATALERHVADQHAYYEWVAADGVRSPLLERAFVWLRENWPADEGPAVLSWGDSRIGNVLYDDGFAPVAVLDWEMAGLAPREVDVGWLVAMHRFFHDLAVQYGMVGLPDLLRVDSVRELYARYSGVELGDLRWYMTYAAIRHGIIMFRITRRQVHFGEAVAPPDPDDMVIHRSMIERMLDGSYWS